MKHSRHVTATPPPTAPRDQRLMTENALTPDMLRPRDVSGVQPRTADVDQAIGYAARAAGLYVKDLARRADEAGESERMIGQAARQGVAHATAVGVETFIRQTGDDGERILESAQRADMGDVLYAVEHMTTEAPKSVEPHMVSPCVSVRSVTDIIRGYMANEERKTGQAPADQAAFERFMQRQASADVSLTDLETACDLSRQSKNQAVAAHIVHDPAARLRTTDRLMMGGLASGLGKIIDREKPDLPEPGDTMSTRDADTHHAMAQAARVLITDVMAVSDAMDARATTAV